MPNDLKTVISSSPSLPFFVPDKTSPISALTCSSVTAPSFFGIKKSPASLKSDS